MTDKKSTSTNDKVDSNDSKAIVNKTAKAPTSSHRKTSSKQLKSNTLSSANKISKLAIFSLIIALIATSGVVVNFLWQQQENMILAEKLTQQNNTVIRNNQAKINALLQQQKEANLLQAQKTAQNVFEQNNQKIIDISNTLSQLEQSITQQQPSDWLIHEAEYLIRIAARTLWLEQDTAAALGLLNDADKRLKELNNPNFLPIRKLIHEDIKTLELMPILQTEEVVLALMALNKQVNALPFILQSLDKNENQDNGLNLSNDTADWQANLHKTWQKFLNEFITIRRRDNTIEALMSPQQQQNLKQNLSLKIQLAIWAVTEQKSAIYMQSINDIKQWCIHYFDNEKVTTQHFIQALDVLEKKTIGYQYSNNLLSLNAIKVLLNKDHRATTIKAQSPKNLKPQVDNKEGSI